MKDAGDSTQGGNSVLSAELISTLPQTKKVEMLKLIGKYKSGEIQLADFLNASRLILGPKHYAQMATRLPQQKRAPAFPTGKPSFQATRSSSLHMPLIQNLERSQGDVDLDFDLVCADEQEQKTAQALRIVSEGIEDSTVDVSKMDTDSLQDVIQYSGIDLKEEADNIIRTQESFLSAGTAASIPDDVRVTYEYYLNVNNLKERVSKVCKRNGLRAFNDDSLFVLSYALREKVSLMAEALHEISRHRVEYHRMRCKVKIDNDPLRQIWVLQHCLKDGSVSGSASVSGASTPTTEGSSTPIATVAHTSPVLGMQGGASSVAVIAALTASNGGSLSYAQAFGRSEQLAQEGGSRAKRLKRGGSMVAKASAPSVKEREDVVIKTKLANVTANQQIGLPQKSWMSSGSVGLQGMGGDSLAARSNLGFTSAQRSQLNVGPASVDTISSAIANRTISARDVLFLMQHDPYFSRSKTFTFAFDSSKYWG